ncbi:MAG: MerR family transcriptional regulator [Prevotellaceae bacterium]|jgi:DNA-binding transcriptional MerR regulator|nr:MerR family transcriptional regulator [Prevotellaceae bacterium]
MEKLYHSITEVAEMLDENASTLRFWEKEFGFPKPRTNAKGTRFYSQEDIDEVKIVIHLLRNEKLTIDGAKAKLKSRKKDDVRRSTEIVEKLEEIKQELLNIKNELKD